MKTFSKTTILACFFLLTTTALAETLFPLSPNANFTIRDEGANGTPDLYDANPDHIGFDGFLTINNAAQLDRHFVEFNLAALPQTWNSPALTFTTAFIGSDFGPSTIQLSYYVANGVPDLSDWSVPTTPLATIPGITRDGGQSFTIGLSSIAGTLHNPGFLGFRFDLLDSQLNQKALLASSIALTNVPEPCSALLILLGLTALSMRRVHSKRCVHPSRRKRSYRART